MERNEQDVKIAGSKSKTISTETNKITSSTLDLIKDSVVIVDQEWRYRFLNEAALKIKNKRLEEVMGLVIWDVHPELVDSKFAVVYREAMATGKRFDIEEYFKPLDAWFHVKVSPTHNGLIVFYKDITARKKAENSRELSNAIIDSSLDAIISRDLNGFLTSWNKGAEKMFGYTKAEAIGKQLLEMTPEHVRQIEEEKVQRIFNGEEVGNFETQRIHKNGHLVNVSVSLTPIKNLLGKIIGVSGIGRDITNIRQANHELKKSQRLYAFLSAINQTIVHSKNEVELLEKASAVAEEVGNYKASWISIMDEEGNHNVNMMYGNKAILEKYREFPSFNYKNEPLKSTVTGRVIATGKYAFSNDVINDPAYTYWKEEMEKEGLQSMISLPLFKNQKMYGVLSIYSGDLNYFEANEIALLLEAAADISFGLEMFEAEQMRRDAENKLEEQELILNESQRMALVGSTEIDLKTGISIWSEEQFRILGYAPNEVTPSIELYLSHIHPDEAEKREKKFYQAYHSQKNTSNKFRIVTKNGEVKSVLGLVKFEFDSNGRATKMYGTTQDITKRVEFEKRLKYNEAFSRAVINSLSSQVGVLDEKGNIIATNKAWKEFNSVHHTNILPRLEVGENLFEHSDKKLCSCNQIAKNAVQKMKDILGGKGTFFKMQYPCRVGDEKKWFNLRVTKFNHKNDMIVVAHEDITKTKLAEQERDATLLELEKRVLQRTYQLRELNTSFTDSVHYAKRIQLGVLTSPAQLKQVFPNSFLFAKASNILSGDFFWCLERDNLKFLAVADCTGHGVPGALMSIIGNTLLNRIIKEGDLLIDPAKILSKLHTALLIALSGGNERKVIDGMDIALCVVNSEEKTIRFAGANRPFVILEKDGTLLEIAGNRTSIGRNNNAQIKSFHNHEFNYKSGQTCYLFSDGFKSQIGGEKGDKLKSGAFLTLLQNQQSLPIEKQKESLHREFVNWQGENPQVDDLIVVGVELE